MLTFCGNVGDEMHWIGTWLQASPDGGDGLEVLLMLVAAGGAAASLLAINRRMRILPHASPRRAPWGCRTASHRP